LTERRTRAYAGESAAAHRPHPDRRQSRPPRAGQRRDQFPLPVASPRRTRLCRLDRLRIPAGGQDRGRPWLAGGVAL